MPLPHSLLPLGRSMLREISKQVARLDGKGFRQLDDVLQRHIPLAALDSADVVAMQSGSFGQCLLGIAPLVAELPQPIAKSRLNGACGHTPMLVFRPL